MPLKRAASMIPAGVKGKGFLQRTSTPLRERYIGNAHVFVGPQLDLVARTPASPASSAYAVTAPVYDQAAGGGPGLHVHHATGGHQHLAARRHPGQGGPDDTAHSL